MAIVNKFNVNKQQVTLDADIIENMSANDVSYDTYTQYNENTVGNKLSELEDRTLIINETLTEPCSKIDITPISHYKENMFISSNKSSGGPIGTLLHFNSCYIDKIELKKDMILILRISATEYVMSAGYFNDNDEFVEMIDDATDGTNITLNLDCHKAKYVYISYLLPNLVEFKLYEVKDKKYYDFNSINKSVRVLEDGFFLKNTYNIGDADMYATNTNDDNYWGFLSIEKDFYLEKIYINSSFVSNANKIIDIIIAEYANGNWIANDKKTSVIYANTNYCEINATIRQGQRLYIRQGNTNNSTIIYKTNNSPSQSTTYFFYKDSIIGSSASIYDTPLHIIPNVCAVGYYIEPLTESIKNNKEQIEYLKDNVNITRKIICYGDSYLEGYYTGSYNITDELKKKYGNMVTIERVLQKELGDKYIVLNRAISGRRTSEILASNGVIGIETINDITLPASGSSITFESCPFKTTFHDSLNRFLFFDSINPENTSKNAIVDGYCKITINGIECLYKNMNHELRLAVPRSENVLFKSGSIVMQDVAKDAANPYINIICFGGNPEGNTTEQMEELLELAIINGDTDKFFIIMYSADLTTSSYFGDLSAEYQQYIKKKYGSRLIDMRAYLMSDQSFIDYGVTKITDADITPTMSEKG